MFTCFIRYVVDPNKIKDFEKYAHAWIALIEKYGGTHHGYFLPGNPSDDLPKSTFSFPNLGKSGPDNIAVALFSFPNLETYECLGTYVNHKSIVVAIIKINSSIIASSCFSGLVIFTNWKKKK